METIDLAAQLRKSKVKPQAIRRKGLIPAVIYGHGIKNQLLAVKANEFNHIYQKAGESRFVDLTIEKETPVKVLIHDTQKDPLSGNYIHVDFYQIRTDEKITTKVPLKFTGVSKAAKEEEGILVKNIDELEVTCLPNNLVSEIVVDISPLKTFDDAIHIKDLKLPQGIEISNNPEEVVATVTPPRSEEELEELEKEAEADVDQVEITTEKKEENEDTEEGKESPSTIEADKKEAPTKEEKEKEAVKTSR